MADDQRQDDENSPLSAHVLERSVGVELVAFGESAVAFDLVTSMIHHVSPVAAWILSRDDPCTVDEIVADAIDSGAPPDAVDQHLAPVISQLRSIGLLGRPGPYEAPRSPGSPGDANNPGVIVGKTHAILAHRVAFRSDDADLVTQIDDFLGDAIDESPNQFIDVHSNGNGGIDVHASDTWCFPSEVALLSQVANVLNDHAARSHNILVIHSGAVRTPTGRTIVIAGPPDAGKSTLVGALIAHGCDYFGDESIGFRSDLRPLGYPKPLTLDVMSRSLLGLEAISDHSVRPELLRSDVRRLNVGNRAIDGVVIAYFQPDATFAIERLEPFVALEAICANVLNLARSASEGLVTVSAMAHQIPVWRMTRSDLESAVQWIMDL